MTLFSLMEAKLSVTVTNSYLPTTNPTEPPGNYNTVIVLRQEEGGVGHTVGRGAGKFPFEPEMGRKGVWGGEKYLVSGRRGLVRRGAGTHERR